MWYLLVVTILIIYFLKPHRQDNGVKNKKGIALIRCRGGAEKNFSLVNIKNCEYAAAELPDYSSCKQGCLNLYLCVSVCPAEALNENMEVDASLCRGCGICVKSCPRELIKMETRKKKAVTLCSNPTGLEKIGNICLNSCRKCYRCLDICPREAVCVDSRGIPETDRSKCTFCGRCVRECPSEARSSVLAENKNRYG